MKNSLLKKSHELDNERILDELKNLEEKAYGTKELIHGLLIGIILGFLLALMLLR